MPLKEEIDKFAIAPKDMEPEKEQEYHDGTVYIDVVNQDPNLRYWFRQKHPFVLAGQDGVVAFSGTSSGRYGIRLAISGSAYRREQYQHVTIEMPKKTMVALMNKIKQVIEWQESVERFDAREKAQSKPPQVKEPI